MRRGASRGRSERLTGVSRFFVRAWHFQGSHFFYLVFSVSLCPCGSLFNSCTLCWSGPLFRDEEFVIGLCHVGRRSDVAARSEPRAPMMRIRLFLLVFPVSLCLCGDLPLSTIRPGEIHWHVSNLRQLFMRRSSRPRNRFSVRISSRFVQFRGQLRL